MKDEDASPAHELLSLWIAEKLDSKAELAFELGVSRNVVGYWCSGRSAPNRRRAQVIESMSRGAVPAYLWPQRRMTGGSIGCQKIRSVLDRKLIGISEAARITEIPQSTLVHVVNGTTMPSKNIIQKINDRLKMKLNISSFRRMP